MTNALALRHNKNIHTKHTHYHLHGNTDQYISVNNILGIKFWLAIEPTSKGSVSLWALWRSLCPVSLCRGRSR